MDKHTVLHKGKDYCSSGCFPYLYDAYRNTNKPNTSMKQKKARLVILFGLVLLSLGLVSSCREKDDLPRSKREKEKEKERGVYYDYSQVRSMALSQDPDRY